MPDTIKFTDDHVEKIKAGEKTSTMRTVKKKHVYDMSDPVTVEGTDIELGMYGVRVVYLDTDSVTRVSTGREIARDVIVETEGFESWEDLIEWFENRNFSLPQPMLLYNFYRMREDLSPEASI